MNEITPAIYNGDLELILSKTFVCNPTQEVRMEFPLTLEKKITFKFVFHTNNPFNKKSIHVALKEDNYLVFTLGNFSTTLGTSYLKPFEFQVGSDKFYLQIFGIASSAEALCLSISIFKGKNV